MVHKGGCSSNSPILGKWPKFLIQSFKRVTPNFIQYECQSYTMALNNKVLADLIEVLRSTAVVAISL